MTSTMKYGPGIATEWLAETWRVSSKLRDRIGLPMSYPSVCPSLLSAKAQLVIGLGPPLADRLSNAHECRIDQVDT